MPSNKYIGYVSGAAIAAGVGAAIAVAGQGTAHADADGSKPASSESKSTAGAKDTKSTKKDSPSAGPKRATATSSVKPKFDPADAIDGLKKQFAGAKAAPVDTTDTTVDTTTPVVAPVVEKAAAETGSKTANLATDATDLATDLATKASETAAVLAKPLLNVSSAASTRMAAAAADSTWYVPNNSPVPWDWNPFRAGDPIPEGMPEVIWQLEKGVVGLLDPIPFFQPLLREGFEFGYRVTQVIPWVNIVLPLSNIVAQIPNLTSGDPVLFKTATQSMINNLLVMTQPVSILFYGYDQLADIFNVEFEAQGLKDGFYSTVWNILDFFDILHNPGESGLPLSTVPAGVTDNPELPDTTTALAAAVKPAAAVTTAASASAIVATTDDPNSDPLRADDPWPTDMPEDVLNTEKAIVGLMPAPIAPLVREAFEAAFRASQIVPLVNLQVPATEILKALLSGGGTAVQKTVNQLLLTWQPIAILYYGYDQAMDLANTEEAGYAAKQQLYATVWDLLDPTGTFHVLGTSGI